MQANKRLYKDSQNRMFLGVCAGFADYFQLDPVIVRMIWVLIAITTFAFAMIAYVVLAIVLRDKPRTASTQPMENIQSDFKKQLANTQMQLGDLTARIHQLERYVTSDEFMLYRKIHSMQTEDRKDL